MQGMEVDRQGKEDVEAAAMDVTEEEGGGRQDQSLADASETVYVKNLNETVKVDVLRQTLKHLFSLYGPVLSVTAHGNVRMRGQAFIAFDGKEPAARAVKEVAGFPLYGKPIQLSFARARSDANVRASDGKEALKAFKEQRLEQKKQKRTQWRKRLMALRVGENEGGSGNAAAVAGGAKATRHDVELPDEYLPPNKILFLHNVPSSVTKDDLDSLFRSHPGLNDVRLIPGRGVAFVEFADAMQSSAARDAINGHHFPEATERLRITFAK